MNVTRYGVTERYGQRQANVLSLWERVAKHPGDVLAAFALARALKAHGETAAMASVLRKCFAVGGYADDPELAIAAIELLDDAGRVAAAFEITQAALSSHWSDARLHAYAGMLALQLGRFIDARRHYVTALESEPRSVEWHVPLGLSSTLQYESTTHRDFSRFVAALRRVDLTPLARAELYFALGKVYDDCRDYRRASSCFRAGNGIRHRQMSWSADAWTQVIRARLAAQCARVNIGRASDFSPIFIVGMPRTGTTVLARLLSGFPNVCNRGELRTLGSLVEATSMAGATNTTALCMAAAEYERQVRQDDSPDALWYIDKEPLNFLHLDFAVMMFPSAKVIRCVRRTRDTALSLWMQCFLSCTHGYSYDFEDVAVAMQGERNLMAHWRSVYPWLVRDVHYEDLVSDTPIVMKALAEWIGLSPNESRGVEKGTSRNDVIRTASLWQARQPVYTRSAGHSDGYAPWIPELTYWPCGEATAGAGRA